MKKRNKVYILILLLFVLSLSIFLSTLFLRSDVILTEKEIGVSFEIGEFPGFNVTDVSLEFGRLSPLTRGRKNLLLSNDYGVPIKTIFSASGDVKNYLVYDPVVYLDVGEIRNINISTIIIPEGTEYGNYTGKMKIVFKRDI